MPRNRISTSSRTSRDTERLIRLASALNNSTSRTEDRYWEEQLASILLRILRTGNDAVLEAAFERLVHAEPAAYEVLLQLCESLSESTVVEHEGNRYDVLLLALPFAVWTRYSIPQGEIRPQVADTLREQLHRHILASNVQLTLLPHLLSVDTMPRSFSATYEWTQRLGNQTLGRRASLDLPPVDLSLNMLADTRFVAAAVTVPEGGSIFAWQEHPDDPNYTRVACQTRWAEQLQPTMTEMLPGCGIEILLPDAWYAAIRSADRRVRALSIGAAVGWLETAANLPPDSLRAVIAGCGEHQVEEYRVGITRRNSNDVIYGCVWPLFGPDDVPPPADTFDAPFDVQDEIAALFKEQGVTDIRHIPGLLPPEFCEDCGSPYFPDPTGEMVHVELPEEAEQAPTHFH